HRSLADVHHARTATTAGATASHHPGPLLTRPHSATLLTRTCAGIELHTSGHGAGRTAPDTRSLCAHGGRHRYSRTTRPVLDARLRRCRRRTVRRGLRNRCTLLDGRGGR